MSDDNSAHSLNPFAVSELQSNHLEQRFSHAEQLLAQYYGYDQFRPGQADIVRSVLAGRDTVAVMPTGAGKSICYQVPALVDGGVTLVISPLISLMKDQVDTLQNLGIAATYINSTLSARETRARIEQAERGAYRLVYVSPERLELADSSSSWLSRMSPSHVAIDEAHCLSQWGHDFRPSYRSIAPALRTFANRPAISALTATATPEVIDDIVRLLDLQDPGVFVTGFDRPNLNFSVVVGQDKRDFVDRFLANRPDEAGIIYAATRKEVDAIYAHLRKRRVAVGRYHAGLSDAERSEAQEQFLYDELRVMVATNAFGMGIDKSNVRFVIHHNMPKNIESYYQEAGRAGRDGDKGTCVLLYSPQDVRTQKFLIEQSAQERQAYEYRKLQAMIDYCHTTLCLRAYMLRYFGETPPERCDNCSQCEQEYELQDATVLAQQVFSCVARVKERFGVKVVAGVLRGSRDKRILELGFDRLSTYGLLKNQTEKEVVGLIQTLVADGYLHVADGKYPVLQLQPAAVPVLKGDAKVRLKVAQQKARVEEVNDALFNQLRTLRRTLAQEQRVPPYVIFSDSTLHEMAARCPQDRGQMLVVKGVGEVKYEKYGAAFLDICRHHQLADESTDDSEHSIR